MKKTISVMIISFILLVGATGCSSKVDGSSGVKQDIKTKEVKIESLNENFTDSNEGYNIVSKGDYYFFSCENSSTYVLFLDWLDESTYEIVDIEIVHFSDGNFFVTYKKK